RRTRWCEAAPLAKVRERRRPQAGLTSEDKTSQARCSRGAGLDRARSIRSGGPRMTPFHRSAPRRSGPAGDPCARAASPTREPCEHVISEAPRRLEIGVSVRGSASVVTIAGELDHATAPELACVLDGL